MRPHLMPSDQREHARQLEHHESGDDERADETGFRQHLAVRHTGRDALAGRELPRQQHHDVRDDRDGDQRHLVAPAHAGREHHGEDAAEHEARGPARMQAIEPRGLVVAELARDQRIDARLHRAVAERQHEGAPVQRPVAVGLQDEDQTRPDDRPRRTTASS